MALQIGDIIDGKYRVIRLLGEGGMGAVYEGENTRIKRRVAIKVLHAQMSKNEELMTRFEREAQAAGRIGSKHIVDVIDLGNLPDGDLFMVMEFLEGDSLADRIEKRGRLQAAELFPIAMQLLSGLEHAHQAKIIHRDLKPDNVFLTRDERTGGDFVKILDFGISKFKAIDGDKGMTRTGALMGTPYYMSPEQARGNTTIDERVDIYAVGVILFHAIAGRVPFDSNTFNDLLFKIALEDPPSVQELVPGVPDDVTLIVMKAMARDRDQRYQTCTELAAAIRGWLEAHGLADQSTQMPALSASAAGAIAPAAVPFHGTATPPTVMQTPAPGALRPSNAPAMTAPGLAVSHGAPAAKSSKPVIAMVAALVLVVGAVVGVVALRGGADTAAASETAESSEGPAAGDESGAEPAEPVEEASAETPDEPSAQPETADSQAPSATPPPSPPPSPPPVAVGPPPTPRPQVPRPPPTPRPQVPPPPPATPGPPPAPKPTGGRVHTTEL